MRNKTFQSLLIASGLMLVSQSLFAAGRGPTTGINHITSVEACDGTLHEFVRHPESKELYHRENQQFWHPMGGILTSEPKPVVGADCEVRVFVRGTTMGIFMRTLTKNWRAFGGISYSAPEPVVVGNDIEITVIGTTNTLFTRTMKRGWRSAKAGAPSPQEFPGIDLSEDTVRDAPYEFTGKAPFPRPRGTYSRELTKGIDRVARVKNCDGDRVFFRRDPYSGALLYKTKRRTQFWTSLRGIITSEPKAIVTDSCEIQVFARGTNLSIFTRGLKKGWRSLGGILFSAPYVQYLGGSDVTIRAVGTDQKVWERTMKRGWSHAKDFIGIQ